MSDIRPEIQMLLEECTAYLEQRRERDKARGECDHSWGYFGFAAEKELDRAAARFQAAFDEAVRLSPRQ